MATQPTPQPLPAQLAAEHPDVAAAIVRKHHQHGGSTTDPRDGRDMVGDHGVVLSIAPEHAAIMNHPPTAAEVQRFVGLHRDLFNKHPELHVGTHHDPDTHSHALEVVAKTSSKGAANNLAHHIGENQTFNLQTGQKHLTGATEPHPQMLPLDQRVSELRAQTPKKEPYVGTHFSDERHDGMIEGARRGAISPKGVPDSADFSRVRLGSQTGKGEDAPAGFYSYMSGSVPESGVASKRHSHIVRGNFAFGSTDSPEFKQGYMEGFNDATHKGADPKVAHKLALNHAEHAMRDTGYDGYFSPHHPNVRFHFGDHVAEPHAPSEAPELKPVAQPKPVE
jgi:hypothetical protein